MSEEVRDIEATASKERTKVDWFGWFTRATLATKITYFRLLLIPFILLFYIGAIQGFSGFFIENGRLVALVLFIVAALTDFLDGWVARRFNQVSELGKILDPAMDKLLVLAGFILIAVDPGLRGSSFLFIMPVYAAVIIVFIAIARDYITTIIRLMGQSKGVDVAADKVAKYKTACQLVGISMFMFLAAIIAMWEGTGNTDRMRTLVEVITYTAWAVMIAATVLTIISGVWYSIKYVKASKSTEIISVDESTEV
ncbi:MAG: CDP-diacylglycerol--glycerol-3-phosphate 3-phosphatidyltransferase [Firmicutes bacterium]|nr:CDP-diacylglycerol--glycerol-3-phosphate 3-phosphatidyltransferase [Bacillota bacterium]